MTVEQREQPSKHLIMATRTSTDARAHLSRPMSVEQIVKEAQNFDYNPLIPLRYWLRTAGSLLKEVCMGASDLSQTQRLTNPSEGRYLRT